MAYGAILGQTNTTYTKDQILSSSDATLLGLPSTATPADMFNVLATVGDLYVWRRTTSSGTDYPVSVNSNAYQEGSDAQPAGYTLGAVQSGNKVIANSSTGNIVYYADSVSVADDGTVSLSNQSQFPWDYKQPTSGTDVLLGKFVRGNSPQAAEIVFIPGDASFSSQFSPTGTGYDFYVSQYQTVTGYPAIPAGTTIEALGKLGDKSRMQIVSYVGTGTYGASNPCSITADFPFSEAYYLGRKNSSSWSESFVGSRSVISELLTTSYTQGIGPSTATNPLSAYAKKSSDGKTLSWYTGSTSPANQLNESGYEYYFLMKQI